MQGVRAHGRVLELWRYPVKSLSGERLEQAEVDVRGFARDRMWALVNDDGRIAAGKTTHRRFRAVPGLLMHGSRIEGDHVVITLADGRTAVAGSTEAARLVEEAAGPGWSLRLEDGEPYFDEGAVHLVTTATLHAFTALTGASLESERLRPNLVIDLDGAHGFAEDGWIGATITVGEARLEVVGRTERCVMVNQARPSLPERRDVLKSLGSLNEVCAGVYAAVILPGTIRLGDEVTVETTT